MINYEPSCGTHIADACREAIELAKYHNAEVSFTFNDLPVTVGPSDTSEAAAKRWNDESERRLEEYHKSPEYAESQRKRAVEVATRQNKLEALILECRSIVSTSQWMDWAYQFAEVADDVGVKFNIRELADYLKSRGWSENAHVTEDESARAKLQTDKKMMAEYIMGQVINCLESGMPPHPMTMTFVDRYRAIPSVG